MTTAELNQRTRIFHPRSCKTSKQRATQSIRNGMTALDLDKAPSITSRGSTPSCLSSELTSLSSIIDPDEGDPVHLIRVYSNSDPAFSNEPVEEASFEGTQTQLPKVDPTIHTPIAMYPQHATVSTWLNGTQPPYFSGAEANGPSGGITGSPDLGCNPTTSVAAEYRYPPPDLEDQLAIPNISGNWNDISGGLGSMCGGAFAANPAPIYPHYPSQAPQEVVAAPVINEAMSPIYDPLLNSGLPCSTLTTNAPGHDIYAGTPLGDVNHLAHYPQSVPVTRYSCVGYPPHGCYGPSALPPDGPIPTFNFNTAPSYPDIGGAFGNQLCDDFVQAPSGGTTLVRTPAQHGPYY